jgi:hypothetical protein
VSHRHNRILFQNEGKPFICVPKCLSPLCYQLPLTRLCVFVCLKRSNAQLHRRKLFQLATRYRETKNTAALRSCLLILFCICHVTLKCKNYCTVVRNRLHYRDNLHKSVNGGKTDCRALVQRFVVWLKALHTRRQNSSWPPLSIHSFIHSFINGSTALCWALASSSVS